MKDLNIRPRFRAIIVKVQASTITSEKNLHKALRNVPAVIIYLLQPEKRVAGVDLQQSGYLWRGEKHLQKFPGGFPLNGGFGFDKRVQCGISELKARHLGIEGAGQIQLQNAERMPLHIAALPQHKHLRILLNGEKLSHLRGDAGFIKINKLCLFGVASQFQLLPDRLVMGGGGREFWGSLQNCPSPERF